MAVFIIMNKQYNIRDIAAYLTQYVTGAVLSLIQRI